MWRHLETLVEELGDEYEYVVVCQDDPEQVERLGACGLRARVVDMPPTIRPIADLRAAWQLVRVIRQEQPAIVHAHDTHTGLLASVAARAAGRPPLVSTVHSVVVRPELTRMRAAVYHLLVRVFAATTDYIICVSEALLNELPRKALRKAVVVPNGVSESQITPTMSRAEALRRLGVKEGQRVVGYVGRLAPEKGVNLFLEMASLLCKDGFRFVVVGDGESEGELISLAKSLQLEDCVAFTGFHAPSCDYLQVFDLTIIPSVFEGLGIAAIESLALGVPVVATAVGGLPEVVSPDVGALVPPGDPQELARTVSGLLRSDRLSAMGQAGRELVARDYTSVRMAAAIRRVYERALGRGA